VNEKFNILVQLCDDDELLNVNDKLLKDVSAKGSLGSLFYFLTRHYDMCNVDFYSCYHECIRTDDSTLFSFFLRKDSSINLVTLIEYCFNYKAIKCFKCLYYRASNDEKSWIHREVINYSIVLRDDQFLHLIKDVKMDKEEIDRITIKAVEKETSLDVIEWLLQNELFNILAGRVTCVKHNKVKIMYYITPGEGYACPPLWRLQEMIKFSGLDMFKLYHQKIDDIDWKLILDLFLKELSSFDRDRVPEERCEEIILWIKTIIKRQTV